MNRQGSAPGQASRFRPADDAQMAHAANELAACSGGQVVVRDSEVIGRVSLPIATLNPFVGIGLFTGVAEAFLRKPRGFAISRTCTPTWRASGGSTRTWSRTSSSSSCCRTSAA
jgi:hypothetical protein